MAVLDKLYLVIGVLLAMIGLAMLVIFRGERGFSQRKQAGLMFLVAAALFLAVELGWLRA